MLQSNNSNPQSPVASPKLNNELTKLQNKNDHPIGSTNLSIENSSANSIIPFHAFGCDNVC